MNNKEYFNLQEFLLKVLSDHSQMNEFEWLQKYKSLYLKAIIQPKGLPPIGNCNLFEQEPLIKKFYHLYEETLEYYLHQWDYEKGELHLLSSTKIEQIDED